MRIVSGTYQGLHLYFQKNKHLRPTQDKVKQAIINRIRSHISGATVLDLYSGVGSYGLEMISNNCESITFLDTHSSIIDKNLEMICLSSVKQNIPLSFNSPQPEEFEITDAFIKEQFKQAQKKRNFGLKINETNIERQTSTAQQFLKRTKNKYDIIFMDPPWTHPQYFEESLKAIAEFTILTPNGIIIVEHPKSVDLLQTGLKGQIYDYGNTKIGIFEHETCHLPRKL